MTVHQSDHRILQPLPVKKEGAMLFEAMSQHGPSFRMFIVHSLNDFLNNRIHKAVNDPSARQELPEFTLRMGCGQVVTCWFKSFPNWFLFFLKKKTKTSLLDYKRLNLSILISLIPNYTCSCWKRGPRTGLHLPRRIRHNHCACGIKATPQ